MADFILDASAMLAVIQSEPGSERVINALETGECVISAVNLSEALAKLVVNGVPGNEAEGLVTGIPVQVVPCDSSAALKAGRLAAIGKPLGLSLGDRMCLATAQVHGGLVLTTEHEWKKVALDGVVIDVIREFRA